MNAKELMNRMEQEAAKRNRDATKVKSRDLTEVFQEKVAKFFPDYEDPNKVTILPSVDATKILLLEDDRQGKGFINEFNVRLIFEEYASEKPGRTYLVVCNPVFRGSRLKGDKAWIFARALDKKFKKIGDAKSYKREQDFILISPKCGLSFAEVKAFSDDRNATGFIGTLQYAKTQCDEGMLCMKAYIEDQITEFCPSLCSDDLSTKLNTLFSQFARFLIFPSLSKKVLDIPQAQEEVEKLAKNFQVLFKEDRRDPKEIIQRIESRFIDVDDQQLYGTVYKIALMCCFIMNDGMDRIEFTPDQRRTTRTRDVDNIEQTFKGFLNNQQNLVRKCTKNVLFVDGVAGSGKTLICLTKMLDTARRYPDQGILYLCKNKNLAEHVSQELEKKKQYDLEKNGMRTYGNINVYSLSDWLQQTWPNLPVTNCNNGGTKEISYIELSRGDAALKKDLQDKYRYVFVDEYQDMTPKMREFLQHLFMESLTSRDNSVKNGTFYVFYDNMQIRERAEPAEMVNVPPGIKKNSSENCL